MAQITDEDILKLLSHRPKRGGAHAWAVAGHSTPEITIACPMHRLAAELQVRFEQANPQLQRASYSRPCLRQMYGRRPCRHNSVNRYCRNGNASLCPVMSISGTYDHNRSNGGDYWTIGNDRKLVLIGHDYNIHPGEARPAGEAYIDGQWKPVSMAIHPDGRLASWYYPGGTALVVHAAPDVLDSINLNYEVPAEPAPSRDDCPKNRRGQPA